MDPIIIALLILLLLSLLISKSTLVPIFKESPFTGGSQQQEKLILTGKSCETTDNRQYPNGHVPAMGYLIKPSELEMGELLLRFTT
jgi:hypothetical protein